MKRFVLWGLCALLMASASTVWAQSGSAVIQDAVDEVKTVLSSDDYQEFVAATNDMYFGESGVQKTAGILDVRAFLAAAYIYGWVDPNIYVWNGKEYEIWPSSDQLSLPPWSGFWVRAKRDVVLHITPWLYDAAPGVGSSMSMTLKSDTYYFVAAPLVPANGDIGANFAADLAPGVFEETARFSKWNYLTGEYNRYTGPGTLPDLAPGRGYWAYQVLGEDKTLTIEGSKFSSSLFNLNICSVALPANDGGPGDHMCGNPFHYDLNMWMLWVEPTGNTQYPVAKVNEDAPSLFENLETWHIDMSLVSADGNYIDTYNRAGVITTGADIHELLSAIDMPAMGDNVRLSILNSDSDTGRYAYDYRSPDAAEYQWDVELSTTLDQVSATLSLENFASVPASYLISLTDEDGVVTYLDSDAVLEVSLNNEEPKHYVLQAVLASPTVVDDAIATPAAVEITGVTPNPFNPDTSISFNVARAGYVNVTVYNLSGQAVASLADGRMDAGSHQLTWRAAGHSSGVYLIAVRSQGNVDYRKVTLIK